MGRHLEGRAGADRTRIARGQLVEKRRLAHRLEHVEVVVAGGAVGPKPDRDPGFEICRTGAVPLASFMLLSGLCETPTLLALSTAISSSVDPHAVRGDDVAPPRSPAP